MLAPTCDTLHLSGPHNPKVKQEIQGLRLSKAAPGPGLILRSHLGLTIKLGHLLAELHLPQDSPELGLVNAGEEPAVGVGEGLAERRLQDLAGWKGGNEVSGGDGLEGFQARNQDAPASFYPEAAPSSHPADRVVSSPAGSFPFTFLIPFLQFGPI